ncbi:MAG: hypothetical protein WBD31_11225 [Rubripirellula sp.]
MSQSQFDSSSDPDPKSARSGTNQSDPQAFGSQPREVRPFLGIQFKCCRTYGRIYRNNSRNAYVGNCPLCAARVSVPIGGGGSSSRFFSAS